jgi:hypothetical protein
LLVLSQHGLCQSQRYKRWPKVDRWFPPLSFAVTDCTREASRPISGEVGKLDEMGPQSGKVEIDLCSVTVVDQTAGVSALKGGERDLKVLLTF